MLEIDTPSHTACWCKGYGDSVCPPKPCADGVTRTPLDPDAFFSHVQKLPLTTMMQSMQDLYIRVPLRFHSEFFLRFPPAMFVGHAGFVVCAVCFCFN
jgi:hypothetical protein